MKNGIAWHARADVLLLSDTDQDRVDIVHYPSGMIVGTIGRGGDSDVALSAPQGIAIDTEDRLWICDTGNARVVVLATRRPPALVFTVGRRGTGPGEFESPTAIAFDAEGTAYVVDAALNRVQAFDRDGKYVGSVSPANGSGSESSQASAIAVTNNHLILSSMDRGIRRLPNPRRRWMPC